MKRQRRSPQSRPGYPDLMSFLRTFSLSAGAGVVTVVAIGSAVPACGGGMRNTDTGSAALINDTDTDSVARDSDTETVGDTAPAAQSYPVSLPESGSRVLVFPDGGGMFTYRVAVILDRWATVYWLEDHVEEALQAIDLVLLQHQPSELPVGDRDEAMEAEIKATIETLYVSIEGVSTDDVLEVALIVDVSQAGE